MTRARQRRLYLLWARPAASLSVLVASGVLETVGSGPGVAYDVLIAASLGAAIVYALAAERFPDELVLPPSLVVDTAIVATATVLLDREGLLVLGYFWILAVSAFLVRPREVVGLTGLTAGAAIAAGVATDADAVTLVNAPLVLALVGGVLAALARGFLTAERELTRERAFDATALRISERVRATLDVDTVLVHVVEELGPALGLTRCLIRLAPLEGAPEHVYQWTREHVEAIGPEAPPFLRRLLDAEDPLVVPDSETADEEVRDFLDRIGTRAYVAYPISWRGAPLAIVAFHDDRPRDWTADALPLLERLVDPIGAALVQAEAFAQQESTVRHLEELTKLREELVASVSHELRTPLTSTIGFLRTLERTDVELDPEHRALFLSTARREAERLARLVDDLLELTRLERGEIPLQRTAADLALVVERAAARVAVPEERQLSVDVDAELEAEVDPDRMLQVFTNLIANAFRHGSGRVVVSGDAEPGAVTVEVSDEGAEIPPERVAQLFVPFARWGSSRESTGLGLAVARRIVEAHGGSLTYRPPVPGRPHAFVVTVPRGGDLVAQSH